MAAVSLGRAEADPCASRFAAPAERGGKLPSQSSFHWTLVFAKTMRAEAEREREGSHANERGVRGHLVSATFDDGRLTQSVHARDSANGVPNEVDVLGERLGPHLLYEGGNHLLGVG